MFRPFFGAFSDGTISLGLDIADLLPCYMGQVHQSCRTEVFACKEAEERSRELLQHPKGTWPASHRQKSHVGALATLVGWHSLLTVNEMAGAV